MLLCALRLLQCADVLWFRAARRSGADFETFPMYGVSSEKHTGSNEVVARGLSECSGFPRSKRPYLRVWMRVVLHRASESFVFTQGCWPKTILRNMACL